MDFFLINFATASQGVTSRTFHILLWILSLAGIAGNILVLVWRCWRKESRLKLLSLLIVSLAVADLCFCCHFLLEEASLVDLIFGSKSRNETLPFTNSDKRLCLSITFLAYLSTNAIMLTVVAISLHVQFSLLPYVSLRKPRCIILFILVSWMACLCLASLATRDVRHNHLPSHNPRMTWERFSIYVIFECTDVSPESLRQDLYPIITTTVNAASSLIVAVLFIRLWYKVRKRSRISSCLESKEVSQFLTRLTIISVLNLICWWPACILFWFTSIKNKSVLHGTVDPRISDPLWARHGETGVG